MGPGSAVEKATAARDVPPGTSWAFLEHRTMAQIIADEENRINLTPENPLICAIGGFFGAREGGSRYRSGHSLDVLASALCP